MMAAAAEEEAEKELAEEEAEEEAAEEQLLGELAKGGAWAVSAGGRSVSLPAVANGSRDGALPPDEDAPADLSGLRLAAQCGRPSRGGTSPHGPAPVRRRLLGRLPARGGWGFAQCWNTMLHEMRRQDLVDNSEETRLQFAIVPRAVHPPPPAAVSAAARAWQERPPVPGSLPPLPRAEAAPDGTALPLLLPPPLGSLKRALSALLAGCPVESLPTLCRLSLAGAADIAMAVVWPLLGAAHQPDVALALRALAAVVPPIAPATDASAAGSAGQSRPCGALPPGLRSERVLYGLRKALQRCEASSLHEPPRSLSGPVCRRSSSEFVPANEH